MLSYFEPLQSYDNFQQMDKQILDLLTLIKIIQLSFRIGIYMTKKSFPYFASNIKQI